MKFVLRGLFRFLPYGGKYHIIFCSLICACETCSLIGGFLCGLKSSEKPTNKGF